MNRIPVIIDCDPGVDDTAALLLACQMPELDIRAVTTVAGNVGLDKTTANAKRVRRVIGADFPIYRGADKPMFRPLVTAAEFHGADGFGGVPHRLCSAYKRTRRGAVSGRGHAAFEKCVREGHYAIHGATRHGKCDDARRWACICPENVIKCSLTTTGSMMGWTRRLNGYCLWCRSPRGTLAGSTTR